MSSIKAPEEFDQYGNPVHGHTIGVTTGVGRSGSSSSTSSVRSFSSEDDGQGGIRKKGLKEKIKDKLPGQGHEDEQAYQTSTPATAGASREGHMDSSGHYREKKGMVETIKEKLPLHARHQH